jgi:hypothetical protein
VERVRRDAVGAADGDLGGEGGLVSTGELQHGRATGERKLEVGLDSKDISSNKNIIYITCLN